VNNNADYEKRFDDLIEHIIIPEYQSAYDKSNLLLKQSNIFCNNINQKNLNLLKKNYEISFNQWMTIQLIRFGPVNKNFRYESIHYWPDKHNVGSKQLTKLIATKNLDIFNDGFFKNTSVALQGFGPLERLLYGKKSNIEFFLDAELGAYRCSLIQKISSNLVNIFSEILLEWKNINTKDLISELNQSKEKLPIHQLYYNLIINTVSYQMKIIIEYKLEKPLGLYKNKKNKRKLESWLNRSSLNNIYYNLIGINLFLKGYNNKGIYSDIENIESKFLSINISEQIILCQNLIKTFHNSAFDIIANDKIDNLMPLYAQLNKLFTNINEELSSEFNVQKGFNANDGD
tara:strand:+ start:3141 stop:4175 length:1035 start_codon:yes stop_codon:yes gene_type:complete